MSKVDLQFVREVQNAYEELFECAPHDMEVVDGGFKLLCRICGVIENNPEVQD